MKLKIILACTMLLSFFAAQAMESFLSDPTKKEKLQEVLRGIKPIDDPIPQPEPEPKPEKEDPK